MKLVEKAVLSARLYEGSARCLMRDQQKLYDRMHRSIEAVTHHFQEQGKNVSPTDIESQIIREASRRGPLTPQPGKDI